MGHSVHQVNESTWIIENGGVRLFLLAGTEKALLIDSGMRVHNARDIAESLTSLPIMLLNTHADMDHIGSNSQFETFYMHPDDEEHYRKSGGKGEIIPVREGDKLDLGGRELKIIHLPGHTAGSIAVLDTSRRVLISGDPIQEHGRIFMFGEHRNMQDYIAGLEHLKSWMGKFDEIWPSHADIPVKPELIGELHDGAQKIMDGAIDGQPEEFHGHEIVAYDLGFTTILCDR